MKRTSTLTYISLSPLLCLVLVWIFWDSRRPSQRSTDNAPSRRFLPSATVEDPQQSAVTPLSDLGAGEGDWEDAESPKEVETAESQQVPAAEEETDNSEGYEVRMHRWACRIPAVSCGRLAVPTDSIARLPGVAFVSSGSTLKSTTLERQASQLS